MATDDEIDQAVEVAGRKSEKGPSQASQLTTLARERFELFLSEDARPFAVRKDGPNIALPLRGARAGLRATLAKIYVDITDGVVPSQSALADTMTVLEGRAADVEPRPVHLRLGRHGESIVIDLGTPDGRCIVVDPGGWRLEGRSPVLFRRTNLTSPMPAPARVDGAGGLKLLRKLLNMADGPFRLLVAWIIASWIPDIPHPVLAFRGEQGTGKSSAARVTVGLVDPSPAPLRSAPRDVKQWAVTASASWAVCLDNISAIAPWLSDTLCKAVTGDGIVDRALYTDDDVTVLSFRRVIVLTSIDAGAFAGDLAERLLLVDLETVPADQRRTEADLNAAYEDARPLIFAALLDLLAQVLDTLPTLETGPLPRMADFARILAAVDKVMSAEKWTTLNDYLNAANAVSTEALTGDPFGMAVSAFVRYHDRTERKNWTGSATDLLTKVVTDKPIKSWPKDATRASGHLRRIAPLLRASGITVAETQRTSRGRKFVLGVAPEKGREPASSASSASRTTSDLRKHDDANHDASHPLASGSVTALPRHDADDDAGPTSASSTRQASDLREHHGRDAGDASDAVLHPISGHTPYVGRWDRCIGCGHQTLRPDIGEPRCPTCREAS